MALKIEYANELRLLEILYYLTYHDRLLALEEKLLST